MKYEYELACKEAGLSEEKINKIRRIFDADHKRLQRRKKLFSDLGLKIITINDFFGAVGGCGDKEIADTFDYEEYIFHRIVLENLKECISKLPADDREFLLGCFTKGIGCVEAGRKLGLTKDVAYRKRNKLIKELRFKIS